MVIGRVIIAFKRRDEGQSLTSDDLDALRIENQNNELASRIWRSWAEAHGSVAELSGDGGVVEVNAERLDELPKILEQYREAVDSKVSCGVGVKLSEALKALKASQNRGGGIVLYTPETETELKEAEEKDKPHDAVDKLSEEYLQKADPALAQGTGAGIQGAAEPAMPSIAKPKAEGSEHSDAEALRPMVEGSQAPAKPEMTNASADLESKMHEMAAAQEQQEQGQQPQSTGNPIKAQVVQVLQQVRAAAPILERMAQSSPEVYEAVMNMTRAVISMARELPQDTQEGAGIHSVAEIDAAAGLSKAESMLRFGGLSGWKAAFRHQQSGEVLPMRSIHDPSLLPGATGDLDADMNLVSHSGGPWEDGFVDPQGQWKTRAEAEPLFRGIGTGFPDAMNLPHNKANAVAVGKEVDDRMSKSEGPTNNWDSEHELPSHLSAEGYRASVAHGCGGSIATIHRGAKVVGRVEYANGKFREDWAGGELPRHGLDIATRMMLDGHARGEPIQDGWNEPSRMPVAPIPHTEDEGFFNQPVDDGLEKSLSLSGTVSARRNLTKYEDMHALQRGEGGIGILGQVSREGRGNSPQVLVSDLRKSSQQRSSQDPSRALQLSDESEAEGADGRVPKNSSGSVQCLEGRPEGGTVSKNGRIEVGPMLGLSSEVPYGSNGLGSSRGLAKGGLHRDNGGSSNEVGQDSGGSGQVRSGVLKLPSSSNTQSPKGSSVTTPHTTYEQASVAKPKTGGSVDGNRNLWVRQSSDTDNSKRTLTVQFSSDLLQGNRQRDHSDDYYDKLYGNREGYHRLADTWEIPQWVAHMAHSMPDTDHYTVRDPQEAIRFANEAGYKNVAFSALDVNKEHVRDFAKNYNGNVVVGGYTDMNHFADLPNVKIHSTIKDFVESEGGTYKPGYDYRHFEGTKTIPRLTLSDGCRHNCAFCCVPKQVTEKGREEIMQQVDAFAKHLPADLIYLNDKTFGQADNHKMLPEIYQRIKAQNPNFKGFVVQTTAAQMKKFTPEFLQQSGIRHAEIGVESFNDPILRAHKKPATEQLIEESAQKLRTAGVSLIPNIMVGLPGENQQTYGRTMDWLNRNKDIISHVNAYNLALYDESDLGKKIGALSSADRDENQIGKSFHTDPKVHQDFSNALFGYGNGQLDAGPMKKSEGNVPYGWWLSPEGELTEVGKHGHLDVGESILRNKHHDPTDSVYKGLWDRGYNRLVHMGGNSLGVDTNKPITDSQVARLSQLSRKHGFTNVNVESPGEGNKVFDNENWGRIRDTVNQQMADEEQFYKPKSNGWLADAVNASVAKQKAAKPKLPKAKVKKAEINLSDLTGGTAEEDQTGITEFDPKQIAKGFLVEMEHTDKVAVALKICLDHLREDKKYYTKLEQVEGKEPMAKKGLSFAPGKLPEAGAKTTREHVVLPVGSQIDSSASGTRNSGRVKTQGSDGKEKWREVRAGQVLGPDGAARSSRSVTKK